MEKKFVFSPPKINLYVPKQDYFLLLEILSAVKQNKKTQKHRQHEPFRLSFSRKCTHKLIKWR